jgi:hypothetical protein
MTRRPLWMIQLPAVLAAIVTLVGCGVDEGPRVATAQPATPAAPGSAPPSAAGKDSDYDKALRYTRCMTQNGAVTADPVEGEPLVTYNRLTRAEAESGATAYQTRYAAHQKCKQFLPTTWPIRWDPQEVVRARSYLECMRRNGIPVPVPDQNGMAQEPTDDAWHSTPEYDAALRKCRHLVDDPANDLPENK